MQNDPFYTGQAKELKKLLWLKDASGNYQPYKENDSRIETVGKIIFPELMRIKTREKIKYQRVKINNILIMSSTCTLERKIRTFDLKMMRRLARLSESSQFFVEIKGHKTDEKATRFFYENWDELLPDLIKKDPKKAYDDRFKIMRAVIGSQELLQRQSFERPYYVPNEFVVIKDQGEYKYKRVIPIEEGFNNGEGPSLGCDKLQAKPLLGSNFFGYFLSIPFSKVVLRHVVRKIAEKINAATASFAKVCHTPGLVIPLLIIFQKKEQPAKTVGYHLN